MHRNSGTGVGENPSMGWGKRPLPRVNIRDPCIGQEAPIHCLFSRILSLTQSPVSLRCHAASCPALSSLQPRGSEHPGFFLHHAGGFLFLGPAPPPGLCPVGQLRSRPHRAPHPTGTQLMQPENNHRGREGTGPLCTMVQSPQLRS